MKVEDLFNKAFFWDCIVDEINLKDDADLIIERVLSQSLNRSEDFEKLKKLFSIEKIKKIAESSTQIFGNERIEDISNHFSISTEKMLNYINVDYA